MKEVLPDLDYPAHSSLVARADPPRICITQVTSSG